MIEESEKLGVGRTLEYKQSWVNILVSITESWVMTSFDWMELSTDDHCSLENLIWLLSHMNGRVWLWDGLIFYGTTG